MKTVGCLLLLGLWVQSVWTLEDDQGKVVSRTIVDDLPDENFVEHEQDITSVNGLEFLNLEEPEEEEEIEGMSMVEDQQRELYHDDPYKLNACKVVKEDFKLHQDLYCDCDHKDAAVIVTNGAAFNLNGYTVACKYYEYKHKKKHYTTPKHAVIWMLGYDGVVKGGAVVGYATNCVKVGGKGHHTVKNMHLKYCGYDCLHITEYAVDSKALYNDIYKCGVTGIRVDSASNRLRENVIAYTGNEGILINAPDNYAGHNDVSKAGKDCLLVNKGTGTKIEYNNLYECGYSCYHSASSSAYTTVQYNTATSCSVYGLEMCTSNDNKVTGNVVSYTVKAGIEVGGKENYIGYNSVSKAGEDCILVYGYKNLVEYNFAKECAHSCFHAKAESSTTYVLYNDFDTCGSYGIELCESNYNEAKYNMVVYTVLDGIEIGGTDNVVNHNDVYKTGVDGIFIPGHKNEVKYNFVTYSGNSNIGVNGDYNLVQRNTVTNSESDGIEIKGCHNDIWGNAVSCSGDDGIEIEEYAQYNALWNNTVSGVQDDGIDVDGNDNNVKHNHVSGSWEHGIAVLGKNNDLFYNKAFGSGPKFFDLFDGNKYCDMNKWKDNYGVGNQDCIA